MPSRLSLASGASLIEHVIVLAVTAVLGTTVVPSMLGMLERGRGASDINALIGSIQLARQTALAARAVATLCASADGRDCGTNWATGHMVFVDNDGDGNRDPDERLVRVHGPVTEGASVRWRAFGARPYLQFTSRGFTRAQNGTFLYCTRSGSRSRARALIVNTVGRVRIAGDGNRDGIVDLPGGRAPDCDEPLP